MLSSRVLIVALLCLAWKVAVGDLFQADMEADRIHSNGKTALMTAAKDGDLARVRSLVQEGADVNQANNNGGTPIMYAALSGDVKTVSFLLAQGADANAPAKNGWTALMIACAKGYVDIARTLLSGDAKPNQADIYFWTPLMRAVFEDRRQIVRLLLNNGSIKINQHGENGVTALHLAVMKGNTELVGELLEAGADPETEDYSGRTPLDFARENNDLQLEAMMKTGHVE